MSDQKVDSKKKPQRSAVIDVSSEESEADIPVKEKTPTKRKLPESFKNEKPLVNPSQFFSNEAKIKQSTKTLTKKIKTHDSDEDLKDIDVDAIVAAAQIGQSDKASSKTLAKKHTGVKPESVSASPMKVEMLNVDPPKPIVSKPSMAKPTKATTPKATTPKKKIEKETLSTNVTPESTSGTADDAPSGKKFNYGKFLAKKASGSVVTVSRPAPDGAPDCLSGKTFVFTGDLTSLSREAAADIVKRYGGRVTSAVSKKTTFLVVGQEPGESKIKKAATVNVPQMTEDEFYDIINNTKPQVVAPAQSSPVTTVPSTSKAIEKPKTIPQDVKGKGKAPISQFIAQPSKGVSSGELWTEKYKPKTYDDVIGNRTLIDKLGLWLRSWDDFKARGFPKGGKDDICFRAVLLSGPPGIGKTTSAHLVSKTEGFEAIEFNASDTRSKKTLDDHTKHKKVIIMDEVDGMSSGDRGGSAELIQIIKKSKIPIICICNDRSSPKIRSLANHCLDLRFRRATAAQVEKRMKLIASKEKLALQPNAIGELVASTSADIRQILNLLSTYRLGASTLSFDDSKRIGQAALKNVTLSPFDIIGKLLSQASFRSSTFSEKIDYYFQDYSMMPLMVQENYISMSPSMARESGLSGKQLEAHTLKLMSEAADSISIGDLVDARQRKENSWSLLPVHATMSTIRPCFFTHGGMQGMYRFSSWLGQNSKQTKTTRLLRQIQLHLRLNTSGDKSQIRLEYMPVLAKLLTEPLVKDESNVSSVIEMMDKYYITKDDWDSIMELGYQPLADKIPTKTKGSFTRNYNKGTHPNPFASEVSKSTSSSALEIPDSEDVVVDDEVLVDEEEEEDTEKPIPGKKPAAKKAAPRKRAAPKASSSKSSKK
ncbi:replication factor RFC1 C terminal domain-containing protein [Globomyces pollinis-pini]|nr:replication factor RFC1 C terminal domain-containing protein [Globomyces pollinis-pini]